MHKGLTGTQPPTTRAIMGVSLASTALVRAGGGAGVLVREQSTRARVCAVCVRFSARARKRTSVCTNLQTLKLAPCLFRASLEARAAVRLRQAAERCLQSTRAASSQSSPLMARRPRRASALRRGNEAGTDTVRSGSGAAVDGAMSTLEEDEAVADYSDAAGRYSVPADDLALETPQWR